METVSLKALSVARLSRNRHGNHKETRQGGNGAQGIAEIQKLVEEIRRHDPLGGCWDWVEINHPDKWRLLMTSMKKIDSTFMDQSPGELTQAIASTRRLHQECVTAWGKRD